MSNTISIEEKTSNAKRIEKQIPNNINAEKNMMKMLINDSLVYL